MERGKSGAQSQLQAMKRGAGNQIGITVLYPGESGATTDKLPVMGTEEQAPVSNNMKTTHTTIKGSGKK